MTVLAFAASGDIAEKIYSTDVLAYINGIPVQSYDIGGRTAVILEDLPDACGACGIEVSYSDELRTLVVNMNPWELPEPQGNSIVRGKTGRIVGIVNKTDIVTYINGIEAPTFSLNGKMAVVLEDLGVAAESGAEWSPYGMRCVKDDGEKTISLCFLYDNSSEVLRYLENTPLSLRFENDKVELYVDYFEKSFGGSFNGNFRPPAIYPIYCSGQIVGTRFESAGVLYFSVDRYGKTALQKSEPEFPILHTYYDMAAIKSIAENMAIPPLTYERVLQYYTEEVVGYVTDRADGDWGTFLYMRYSNSHGWSEGLVRIAKNGSYRAYDREFESVSFSGNIQFDYVEIENDKVTFSYDKYYEIDLKTGEMRES